MISGVTTGPADPASGGAAPLGGGILKICWKNWQIYVQFDDGRRTKKSYWSTKPSDLTTADEQKKLRGRQKSGRGGQKPPGGGKKKGREKKKKKKKVDVKSGSVRELDGGAAKWRPGGRHFASFRHWVLVL